VIALQIAGPSSRQRGRPQKKATTLPQEVISGSTSQKGARHQDILTVNRKVTSPVRIQFNADTVTHTATRNAQDNSRFVT
jgi:hypothetical protein